MTSGLLLIVVAISMITLSNSFDGFVQGLLGGAGVALVLIGVAALPSGPAPAAPRHPLGRRPGRVCRRRP